MEIRISSPHPFPVDAVAFNSFDHTASATPMTTSTGVAYDFITHTPRNTPGFDYDRFFVFAGAPSAPTILTYSFDVSVAAARNGFLAAGAPDFTADLTAPSLLSAAERANAISALAEVSAFANVVFQPTTGFADINYFHDPRFGVNGFSRFQFSTSWSVAGAYEINDVVGMVVIGTANDPFMFRHELAHVLSLKHVGPFQSDAEGPLLPPEFRDSKYTIMFYDITHSDLSDPGERVNVHFQLFDVYALQLRFGANTDWRSGDDIYRAADFDGNRQTLWDAGGVDTLDFSDQSVNQTIDLRDGAFSTLGGFLPPTENLSIAFGAIIENAFGGTGDDALIGNDASNLLSGSRGQDNVFAGAGDDDVYGGAGDDSLAGEAGRDMLYGGAGHDNVSGGNGNDLLDGAEGRDTLSGGKGFDLLFGGADRDLLTGEDLSDTLLGGDGNDTLNGGIDNDRLLGEAQRDLIFGDAGDDIIDGGTGDDTVDAGGQRDSVFGGSGLDSIDGGNGNDTLTGGADGDTLLGGAGFDILQGDAGDDVLNGGASNDVLFGNAGDDTIVFDIGGGIDTLRDFTAGAASEDVIILVGFGAAFNTFGEVIAAATQSGAHVTVDFGGGDMLVIRNTLVASLHADDFTFG